jgi:hypothetical protein
MTQLLPFWVTSRKPKSVPNSYWPVFDAARQ